MLKLAESEWTQMVNECRSAAHEGKLAEYIPALKQADPASLGICMLGADGTEWRSGEWDVPFTMQSISKVLSFIASCMGCGIERVLQKVDLEPTGDPFNSIFRLEIHQPGKPFNPLINAGAIVIASILPGSNPEEKLERVQSLVEAMIHRRPAINNEVYLSEWETADRNRSIAYYLKGTGFLEVEVDLALEVYLKLCALEITTEDLAKIGLVLALDGHDPFHDKQIIPKKIAKVTKALMVTCGMYDASGKFAAFVGVPSKSGVSGGILTAIPPRCRDGHSEAKFQHGCGIGIYGPAIDEYGNSKAGSLLLDRVVEKWGLHIF